MALHRHALPQLLGRPFVTDGGLETTLIYQRGLELPHFAAIALLASERGRQTLREYYQAYRAIAARHHAGFIFEAPTWRASSDWGARLGLTARALDNLNRAAIELLVELRDESAEATANQVVSACLGPRGDGYIAADGMTVAEAEHYHRRQIELFSDTDADMVHAMTINTADEAIGIVRVAQHAELPVAISFTVETDGRLPSGEPLAAAITRVDAATDRAAAYFGINCAHPSHFDHLFLEAEPWHARIASLRANASSRSHAELDAATELDAGDPDDLAARYGDLERRLPNLAVLGGCCGTDTRHVTAMCRTALGSG